MSKAAAIKAKKELKLYIVCWTYDGDEQFSHLVRMTESQADGAEKELQERVDGGTLRTFTLEEAEEISHERLVENMEEEGLRSEDSEEEVA